MKLTKNIISKEQAKNFAPDYVEAMEGKHRFTALMDKVIPVFSQLKRGQKVITFHDGKYVLATVSSLKSNCPEAMESGYPITRVTNGEYSWRVDGCNYAYPIKA
jgi:hypothetical protein